jgi:hypothetical protein
MAGNNNVVLITGKPSSGKSTSLMNMSNPERWMYLNTDLKELPFKPQFKKVIDVDDAVDVLSYIEQIEGAGSIDGVCLDTLTFLMGMYERQYVVTAADTMKAWGNYGNFYREFIHAIKAGSKDYAIFAHEDAEYNEAEQRMESKVPVKGAVGRLGVEADFTTILAAKKVSVKELKKFPNDLLHITEEEIEDGEKYVFMTRSYKGMADKTRSPIGLFSRKELYIDNCMDQVFKRIKTYYN